MTQPAIVYMLDALVIVLLLLGVGLFRSPQTARIGNLAAMAALTLAIASTLIRNPVTRGALVASVAAVGAASGVVCALRVNMLHIPAMVAFQHGAGGLAALLVSLMEVYRGAGSTLGAAQTVSGLVGMLVGAATFSASLIASGKLSGLLSGKSFVLPTRASLTSGLLVASVVAGVVASTVAGSLFLPLLTVSALLACVAGVTMALPIGGADMPVLISFLNATAGFAAAFCGVTIGSRLLVVSGAMVAASGSVLTHVMCRAMNRRLGSVLQGSMSASSPLAWAAGGGAPLGVPESSACDPASSVDPVDPITLAREHLLDAERVVIIPGYGMAVAQAQFEVARLFRVLEKMGKHVKFGIHPVAGRMPGHMHVLLAEADVPYDRLYELEPINDELERADVALVVGACDVINPAAMNVADCPISGMPILRADLARHILVFNYDDKPGYSGVENPLYQDPKTVLVMGDAKETLARLFPDEDPL